ELLRVATRCSERTSGFVSAFAPTPGCYVFPACYECYENNRQGVAWRGKGIRNAVEARRKLGSVAASAARLGRRHTGLIVGRRRRWDFAHVRVERLACPRTGAEFIQAQPFQPGLCTLRSRRSGPAIGSGDHVGPLESATDSGSSEE